MGEDEFHEESEVAKSINAWRQSERKVMIDTIQDLIQTSHKYAKSQYTPSAQRARWTKLAGQLIWYMDQILKSFSLKAMTIEMQALKKLVMESEKERDRENMAMRYPRIVFDKPRNGKEKPEKSEEGETLEAAEADEPEAARANVSDSH